MVAMQRFALDETGAGGPETPDAVLAATRELVAAAATLDRDPARYGDALRAFRFAVRRRFYLEVTLGLPPDVVSHVMRCALRMAVETAPRIAGRRLLLEIGALTLARAERSLRDDAIT
jgi:hypothetical protein